MEVSYKEKKVISIDIASELTELSKQQIWDYEEQKLIFPERLASGARKYSFADVERLIELSNEREDGRLAYERDRKKESPKKNKEKIRDEMILGQLNAAFGLMKDRY